MIDPPIAWIQGSFRGTRLESREDGIYDLVQWVGEIFYPFIPDFVEEGRALGFSRLLSPSIDLSKVVPYKSRLIFIHTRARAEGHYSLQEREDGYRPCPDKRTSCSHPSSKIDTDPPCVFATWELSALITEPKHAVIAMDLNVSSITTPSVEYNVFTPINGEHVEYSPALFLALPITHFEVVGKCLSRQQGDKLGPNVQFTAIVEQ